jgi:hypothetical protein
MGNPARPEQVEDLMAFRISEAARRKCWEQIQVERVARTADLRKRLEALVTEHGTDSLYGDMLAGMNEREAVK